MKFSSLLVGAGLLALSATAMANDDDIAYANQTVYPAALMTQGFFVSIDGLYTDTDRTLASKVTVSPGGAVTIPQPWGFGGSLGYETHFGNNGTMIAGVEAGYRYMGKLSFAPTSGTVPKDFRLQAATGTVDLGMQMGRMDLIAKGGAAVEIGGKYQPANDASSTVYRFDTRVEPMAGGELGFAVMPNLKFSVEGDYIFGHQLTGSNIGNGAATAPKGGYRAFSGLVGLTYYMN